MGILSVDTSNVDELLKKKTYEPTPGGIYTFEVANDLKLTDSKSSDNKIVQVELRVVDEGDFKGKIVYDNLVIGATPEAKKKCDWKIAQFAVACGFSKDELNDLDLDRFKGCTCSAKISIETSEYEGETKKKNVVKEYLFESEDE